ncbi:MAG: DUF4959 domain-containing protein [Prevotellaceae bacterium]|jgi:hypothetical protein|nr:DUF4959 domain-containing protein [Prevotellaceae bacterium]
MKKIYLFLMLPLMLWQCSELRDWNDPTDNVAPGTVSNIQVKNTYGGAIINYTLPGDKDLLGVKAVYSLGDEVKEVYASAFTDTIVLEGYSDTESHTVELFVFDKSNNLSVPAQTTINPLTPPIELIRKSLVVNSVFGGIFTRWDNNFGKTINFGVTLLREDSTGLMVVEERYFSNLPKDQYAFRGFDSIPYKFRIELRDRYGNSAALDTVITPLYETRILGRTIEVPVVYIWKQYGIDDNTARLRGDITWNRKDFNIIHTGVEATSSNYWQVTCNEGDYDGGGDGTGANMPPPLYFTIDMGRMANYSRFAIWMRNYAWSGACLPQDFEVWGTNDPKPVSEIGGGDQVENLRYWTNWSEVGNIKDINGTNAWMNDWEKLSDCWLQLPSGITHMNGGTVTADDQAFINAGFRFDVISEMTTKAFRYIRFYIKDYTYIGAAQLQISQISFYGAYAD